MKIFLAVGHSRLKNGSYTSADGTRFGGGNEYMFCKDFSAYLERELREKGYEVTRVVCPEGVFTKSTQERLYKLQIENAGKYDLTMELHLNSSSNSTAKGCEVLYKTMRGKRYADRIQKELARFFRDRGVKKRDNLYILNQTRSPAVLIELFFCTNKDEWKYANDHKEEIAKAIADAV